jgi:hypothetical protein
MGSDIEGERRYRRISRTPARGTFTAEGELAHEAVVLTLPKE